MKTTKIRTPRKSADQKLSALTKAQTKKREEMIARQSKYIPTSAKSIFKRAWYSNSKLAAIKAFCLECTGCDRKYVEKCPSFACPLWIHRPFQKKQKEE